MVTSIFGFVALSAAYRLPDFRKIDLVTASGWTQIGDLIGISLCTGRNLIPSSFYSGVMTPARLEHVYHPEHGQLSFGPPPLLQESGFSVDAELVEATAERARKEHPLCYLRHRARVFLYTMGANSGSVFYLTHPDVHSGEASTEMKPSWLTVRAVELPDEQ